MEGMRGDTVFSLRAGMWAKTEAGRLQRRGRGARATYDYFWA